jgi:hypothetical protein
MEPELLRPSLEGRLTPEERETWDAIGSDGQAQLLQWESKPWTTRGRRSREDELIRQLALGLPQWQPGSPPVTEDFVLAVIFGSH